MKIKELVYNDFKLTDVETSAEELAQLLRLAEEASTLIDMEELEQVVRSGEDQGELVQPCAKSKTITIQEVLNEELHEFKVGDLTPVKRPEVVGERFKAADYVRIHKDVDFNKYTYYPFMNSKMQTLVGFKGTVVRVSDETVTVMTHPESKAYEWLKEDVSHVFSRGGTKSKSAITSRRNMTSGTTCMCPTGGSTSARLGRLSFLTKRTAVSLWKSKVIIDGGKESTWNR